MRAIINPATGKAAGDKDADYGDGSLLDIGHANAHRVAIACALVMRDYINELRALGIIGLGSKTLQNLFDDIKAKL